MEWNARRGLRRHLSLLVSGGLVLLIGALGLVAGSTAGQQAREVHRADRLDLQRTLAGLVEQYSLLSAAEVLDALAAGEPWSPTPDDPESVRRLEQLVEGTRALDAGAILVSPMGQRLATWSPDGALPAADDPGWAPLRAAVLSGKGTLPLSGILQAGDSRLLAMGLPVSLAGGSRALVIGLWDARAGGLQQYVSELEYGQTGHGYVVDGTGHVIAGPTPDVVGKLLPLPDLRAGVARGGSGIVDTADDSRPLVTSYADAGATGWTALTPQDKAEFEGGLLRSSRLVQGAVVALLLIAGAGLVVLHHKRETALEVVALRDELTGLYNRRGWFVLAEHELERARRQGTARVLLFVDVDGLKQVNDTLGHREGDRAIADAAALFTAASRSSDIVGRLGGDEFVLLLGDDGKADVARQRLFEALQVHNERSSAGFELRLSIGSEVWFPNQACTLDDLVTRADAEMYADKTSRPGRHEGLLRVPGQRSAEPDAVRR
jgi:diguanylate cyclase (GGDEF)-like protein